MGVSVPEAFLPKAGRTVRLKDSRPRMPIRFLPGMSRPKIMICVGLAGAGLVLVGLWGGLVVFGLSLAILLMLAAAYGFLWRSVMFPQKADLELSAAGIDGAVSPSTIRWSEIDAVEPIRLGSLGEVVAIRYVENAPQRGNDPDAVRFRERTGGYDWVIPSWYGMEFNQLVAIIRGWHETFRHDQAASVIPG